MSRFATPRRACADARERLARFQKLRETNNVFQCGVLLAIERESKHLSSSITPVAQACAYGLFEIIGTGPVMATPTEIGELTLGVLIPQEVAT